MKEGGRDVGKREEERMKGAKRMGGKEGGREEVREEGREGGM